MGASDSPSPRTKWHKKVNRLVRLYPKTTNKAIGDKKNTNLFMNQVVPMNNIILIIIKMNAAEAFILPAGISLTEVRGFNLSI